MSRRSRRQTRTRLTTGYPPELHNAEVASWKSTRRALRNAAAAMRTLHRLQLALAALRVPMDALLLEAIEREDRWQRRDRLDNDDCIRCMTATSTTPMHDASPACESGRRDHCTCAICY